MQKQKLLLLLLMGAAAHGYAQKKPSFDISGTMGVTYEGYGLNRNPAGWTGFNARKPWNQVKFNFTPTMQFGKDFKLPFNFNFAALPTNFAGPYAGISKQNFGQWITNPLNSFGLNPTYKWAELQLGTQYLNYSNLSTGDVGVFGAGFDLKPGTYRIKFFTGISQQGINFFGGPSPVTGAYKRVNWMAQLGKEKEGKYELAFNFAKGKDQINSVVTPPPTVKPQEGFTISMVTKVYFNEGWYVNAEGAQSLYTKDLTQPLTTFIKSFKPFLDAHTSTIKDYAAEAGAGKKSKNFDIGLKVKYLGAGFQTVGYPFLQPDKLDYTLNTRFNAMKNKSGTYRSNVLASIGQRVNNVSSTTLRAKQFIGNLNWFTQFDDHFSLNVNYNNFGFQAPSGLNPFGIKNVSNDFGVSPTYTWSNSKMSNMISLSYNFSKYDERDVLTGLTTSNNTHTALLTYVPVYFNKDLSPDFSVMYFLNKLPGFKTTLFTISSGLSMPAAKKKLQLRGQLQYTLGKNQSFTSNNNFIASCTADWKLNKRLTWTNFMTTNYYKYGNEITPNGANYLESNFRTGFQYRFETKKK